MLKNHHDARFPFLLVATTEEDRIIRENRAIFEENVPFYSWDIQAGYQEFVKNGGNKWTW